MKCRIVMTVVFEQPFYKGIFERFYEDQYAVAKINLGTSLPKTRDIYRIILTDWDRISFTDVGKFSMKTHKMNPKRRQRSAQKQVHARFQGSRSQQAIQVVYEKQKKDFHKKKHDQILKRKQQQFEIRQLKKKQKHRGH